VGGAAGAGGVTGIGSGGGILNEVNVAGRTAELTVLSSRLIDNHALGGTGDTGGTGRGGAIENVARATLTVSDSILALNQAAGGDGLDGGNGLGGGAFNDAASSCARKPNCPACFGPARRSDFGRCDLRTEDYNANFLRWFGPPRATEFGWPTCANLTGAGCAFTTRG
jgi:hypothetical protein